MVQPTQKTHRYDKWLKSILPTSVATIGILGVFYPYLPTKLFFSLELALTLLVITCGLWLLISNNVFRRIFRAYQTYRKRKHEIKQKSAKSRQEAHIVSEWVNKWRELANLIDQAILGTRPPTEEEESQYKDLHKWFISNRTDVPYIWVHFWRDRVPMNTDDSRIRDFPITEMVLQSVLRDPFSIFYGHDDNIPLIALALKLQIIHRWPSYPEGEWQKDERKAIDTRKALIFLNDRTTEFLEWHKIRKPNHD